MSNLKTKSIFFITLIAVILTTSLYSNIYKEIARENLKSLTEIDLLNDSEETLVEALINEDKSLYFQVLQDNFKSQLNPSAASKRRFVYSLLSEYEDEIISEDVVLDKKSWQDLEILCGSTSKTSLYLASQVDRTSTEIGKAMLYKKIIQPTDNIEELNKTQEIVKELLSNEALFNSLDNTLRNIEKPENVFMSFWDDKMLNSIVIRSSVELTGIDHIPFFKRIASALNKNEKVLNARNLIYWGYQGFSTALTVASVLAVPMIVASYFSKSDRVLDFSVGLNEKLNMSKVKSSVSIISMMYWISHLFNRHILHKKSGNGLSGSMSSMQSSSSLLDLFFNYKEIKNSFNLNNMMQEKLRYTATYINSVRNIIKLSKENPTISLLVPSISTFEEKVESLLEKSDEVNHLFNLLESKTFNNKKSWITNFANGEIWSAYRIMHEVKNLLIGMVLAVGELDVYMSIARLYKEFENRRVKFCFPVFDLDSSSPAIQAKEFWNPMVNNDVVVANSISLGKKYNQAQNTIITGPNAGGKSIAIKGLLTNIILAQSLGVAPASELTITPFSKIMTYLNITDDIAAGNSHFKAGVLRARDLISMVKTVQNSSRNMFSLTAVDEVFNGTTPLEGQAAAYSMIKLLGDYENNMCLTATHFSIITNLEEKYPEKFINYKVSVNEDSVDGKIQYPYILSPGISHQIVTFKILKEEGFDDSFLSEAEAMLAL